MFADPVELRRLSSSLRRILCGREKEEEQEEIGLARVKSVTGSQRSGYLSKEESFNLFWDPSDTSEVKYQGSTI